MKFSFKLWRRRSGEGPKPMALRREFG